jgi:polyisoprenyl-phosphate glycosyltransferase
LGLLFGAVDYFYFSQLLDFWNAIMTDAEDQSFRAGKVRKGEGITLSVVVPVYNEAEVLLLFYQRLIAALDKCEASFEVIFVDDGSSDSSPLLLAELCCKDGCCSSIHLSRNFGKEAAMTAGIDFARGEAVIVIDADLQDPPEIIPQLVEKWRAGVDVVYAKRADRDGETWLKRATAYAFYRVIRWVSDVDIPEDTGDFRLLSRRAVEAIKVLPERHRFMKGLFSWVGFERREVLYHRECRAAGHSKWGYWKLWNFALEGITAHTTIPLKVSSYIGGGIAFCSFIYAFFIVLEKLIYGNDVAGYPSLMVAILFIGGVQLMTLGVIGEYLARMFDEVKQRPLYLVASSFGPIAGIVNDNESYLRAGEIRKG